MLKARRTETEVPLSLALSRGNGPVTGATVLVAVRDGDTQDSYLDFADATFKTAGHTTRQAAVADIGGGFYSRAGGLDVDAITNLPAGTSILVLEFEVTAPANATGVAMDSLLLEDFVDDAVADIATLSGDVAALNDLAQSDILSDATPFPGANIDVATGTRASQVSVDALEAAVVSADLVVAAASTPTEVRTDATQADDFYNEMLLVVINSAGVAARYVQDYANTNGAFTLRDALPFTPSASDRAVVLPADFNQQTFVRKIESNRWRIDTGANTMTFFQDDGTTPLLVVDLLDAAASPSTSDVFERDPV